MTGAARARPGALADGEREDRPGGRPGGRPGLVITAWARGAADRVVKVQVPQLAGLAGLAAYG